jgi:hypothetical protein
MFLPALSLWDGPVFLSAPPMGWPVVSASLKPIELIGVPTCLKPMRQVGVPTCFKAYELAGFLTAVKPRNGWLYTTAFSSFMDCLDHGQMNNKDTEPLMSAFL